MDNELETTLGQIRDLNIQGARGIALSALIALKNIASKKGFGKEFAYACSALEAARPTAVPLHNVIEIAKKEKSLRAIGGLLKFLAISDKSIAAEGAGLIKSGMAILTHCHSSEAVALMKLAKAQGKKIRVVVTETRPRYQGTVTAKELLAAKIPVDYVVDSAAGYFVKDVDIAIFGCDAIRPEGSYNKIGTYMMALACKENKIPVYFAGNSLKIDMRKSIKIEMRPEHEIIPQDEVPGAKIRNPAFDCTPWKLASSVVTETGVFRNWKSLAKR